ncbi:MAG: hypothetical protein A2782_00445 [Candidatus Blackburnbacteria bacterium RIFCSPHIGHO2_01_FULL_43_15b]|uniref:Uncharacterized protein n=1 Tax=Candidatus Blackburnbacteria bacterium RIFCSPHIGHO2_01_FULL_43_15b TaxID=1797513 RepID=A0A1G1UYM0_9BACT|nr:MAG: hypothetical protein A2782_00445 [Candidatus Blackburnbacteria bacterium RIFCSPHIGHO2_01_FULL_43_15b]
MRFFTWPARIFASWFVAVLAESYIQAAATARIKEQKAFYGVIATSLALLSRESLFARRMHWGLKYPFEN